MSTKNLLLAALTMLFSLHLNAQCVNGIKSYPIYKTGAKFVEKFDQEGAEIVRIEYDLIFSSKESYRNLSTDWEYVIIGFADEGVKDLNIKLYEFDDLLDKWKVVAEDTSPEVYGIVTYKPKEAAMYKVEVIAQEFYEGYSAARYGLMYLHE